MYTKGKLYLNPSMELLPAGLQQVDIAGGVDGIAQLSVLPLTEPIQEGHNLNHDIKIDEKIFMILLFHIGINQTIIGEWKLHL